MNRLWAPWRMRYIQQIDQPDAECVFCTKPKEETDRENLILLRGRLCFVVMNLYPYNNGHLMVVPYQHASSMSELGRETVVEMWELCDRCVRALTEAFHAEGFNIGLNLGRVAGAGIDQHLHLHIVPRWNGDTNYMPVTGDTKVISQSLEDAFDALKPYFQERA